jgi:hypothetical protein
MGLDTAGGRIMISFGKSWCGKQAENYGQQLKINYGNSAANYGKCAKNYGNWITGTMGKHVGYGGLVRMVTGYLLGNLILG